MTDPMSLEFFTTLGVGGVLAGVIFFFYRKDVASYKDEWRGMTLTVLDVVRQNTISHGELASVVRELKTELQEQRHARTQDS